VAGTASAGVAGSHPAPVLSAVPAIGPLTPDATLPALAPLARASSSPSTTTPTTTPSGPSLPTPAPAGTAPSPYENLEPYYEVSPTGAVWPLGGATVSGSLHLAAARHTSVIDVAVMPSGAGYWLLTADGGITGFGQARFYGSPRAQGRPMHVARIVATADGKGYWVVGVGGAVRAYGDATGHGGLFGRTLPAPIVDLAPTPDGGGYWLLGADGSVYPFGDASGFGTAAASHPALPVVSIAPTLDGQGYWILGQGGRVWAFGDAQSYGGIGGLNQTVQSIVATPDDAGYWIVTHDGDIHDFGDATDWSLPVTGFVHQITTIGDQAVEWAMAQLGKPYQWGATGPSSFDCSGLSMESWASVDTMIPRVANDQFVYDPKVSIKRLTAGDLVFWASDPTDAWSVEHVAIYLGGGHMVNAPYTGQVVRTDWIGGPGFVNEGVAPAPPTEGPVGLTGTPTTTGSAAPAIVGPATDPGVGPDPFAAA
jgi:hypothetical protein